MIYESFRMCKGCYELFRRKFYSAVNFVHSLCLCGKKASEFFTTEPHRSHREHKARNRILVLMYAILDIETTGGTADSDRIIEIAILLHDGTKVTEKFSSLIHPEERIPYRISMMTGITDEMVRHSPKFYEVAKQVVEMTEGRTIVAHNAAFDYQFLRNEFARLAFPFQRKKLCTVKLAKKLIPGLDSYSLGRLCERIGIELKIQHRAEDDALATAELFEMLLARDRLSKQAPTQPDFSELELKRNIDPAAISHLPETCGVYYFYNAQGDLIYVGKSVNIRSRVLSHFANSTTQKAMEMKNHIARIDYAETGSELIALLKESEEIKEYKPFYNRAQRRESNHVGMFHEVDKQGYIRFRLGRVTAKSQPVTTFPGNASARGFMEHLVMKYELCEKLAGIFKAGSGACFKYHIQQCKGACLGKESQEDYNERAKIALQSVAYDHENMIIIDAGRNPDERSVIVVEGGRYLGFGYTTANMREIQWLRASVKPARDNRDVHAILKGYLTRNAVEDLIIY